MREGMSLVAGLRLVGQTILAFADELAMIDARLARLGVGRAPLEASERGVTAADQPIVWAAHDSVNEVDWLRPGGVRDATCVRLGLTRAQVARILAVRTKLGKRNGGDSPAVAEEIPVVSEAADDVPTRNPCHPPLDGMPVQTEYPIDDTDRRFVLAARKKYPEASRWRTFVDDFGTRRRLTRQQIAGIVAAANRQAASR